MAKILISFFELKVIGIYISFVYFSYVLLNINIEERIKFGLYAIGILPYLIVMYKNLFEKDKIDFLFKDYNETNDKKIEILESKIDELKQLIKDHVDNKNNSDD